MSYIRLSMALPQAERTDEIRHEYEILLEYLVHKPGFLAGWVVRGQRDGTIGRLSVWESEAAANRAATDSYVLALHAKVRSAATEALWDRSFASDELTEFRPLTHEPFDPEAVVEAAQGLLGHGSL